MQGPKGLALQVGIRGGETSITLAKNRRTSSPNIRDPSLITGWGYKTVVFFYPYKKKRGGGEV